MVEAASRISRAQDTAKSQQLRLQSPAPKMVNLCPPAKSGFNPLALKPLSHKTLQPEARFSTPFRKKSLNRISLNLDSRSLSPKTLAQDRSFEPFATIIFVAWFLSRRVVQAGFGEIRVEGSGFRNEGWFSGLGFWGLALRRGVFGVRSERIHYQVR